ncbi:NAD(P)H-dependent oxidoreductase [Neobacillus sp. PS3-34]|nr:NAD(P)H-dependent oxidoreductase [Neobacillus sp. PS3-34]WML48970.1 NAD(P)H-dependent oxidoreductase [Neobacillus sp. PS3-34]
MADFVLFQFPLWWLSVPAILKGWVDRVFAMGWLYGPGVGFYDQGGLKGKKTMLSVTTGGPEIMFSKHGISGDMMEQVLHHIHRGILSFSGMDVLPPFVAYGAAHHEENRKKYLASFNERLLTLETTPSIPYHPNSHYDSTMQLKSEYRK